MGLVRANTPWQMPYAVLPEGTAVPPAAAGQIMLYGKPDDRLYQRGPSGVEQRIALDPQADSWTTLKLTADTPTPAILGSIELPGLTFAPSPATEYEIEALIPSFAGLLTVGAQAALLGPTVHVDWSAVQIITPTGVGATVPFNGALNQYSTVTIGLTAISLITIRALVKTGAVVPADGNIRIGLRTTLAVTPVTAKAGAFLRYRAI